MVFRAWAHERVPLNSQQLVLRIGGTDFLHCWATDSISLEGAESLIIELGGIAIFENGTVLKYIPRYY